MWKRQKKRLDRFYKHYGKFQVASQTTYGIWRYYTYPSSDAYTVLQEDGMTDRRILKDEIVLESDLPMRKMNRGVSEMMEKRLLKYNVEYEKWHSGNKSYHIHIHFPELLLIHNKYDLKLLKRLFMLWMYDFNEEALAKHNVDLHLASNHLISLEFSWHRLTNERKRLVSENISDRTNMLPIAVWIAYSKIKRMPKRQHNNTSPFKMRCILHFLNNRMDDGRKRIAFILFKNLKGEFGVDKAAELIIEWNKMHDNHILEEDIDYMISYHANSNQIPRCGYIKDVLRDVGIDLCKDCEVYK